MKELFEAAEPSSVDKFINEFTTIESGKPFAIPSWPNEFEARQLAQLPLEISILQFKDGQNFLIKGQSKTKTALTRGDLLELPIVKKAHTHPEQSPSPKGVAGLLARAGLDIKDIDYDSFSQFLLSFPSPEDLTLATLSYEEIMERIWKDFD